MAGRRGRHSTAARCGSLRLAPFDFSRLPPNPEKSGPRQRTAVIFSQHFTRVRIKNKVGGRCCRGLQWRGRDCFSGVGRRRPVTTLSGQSVADVLTSCIWYHFYSLGTSPEQVLKLVPGTIPNGSTKQSSRVE